MCLVQRGRGCVEFERVLGRSGAKGKAVLP